MKSRAAIVVFMLFSLLTAQAQGTFENLNFEQATPVVVAGSPYYPYGVTAASAFPYWTVSIGGTQQTDVTENDPSTGSTWVSIVGPGSSGITVPGSAYSLTPIDGNYSALLQGGITASDASISQTGLIPASMQSLLFEAEAGAGSLDVSVGNQNISFTALESGPNYTLYGANISAWAGQTEQITFSALQDGLQLNNWMLDDISFSPTAATPEPNTLALMLMGGAAFGARLWHKRRS